MCFTAQQYGKRANGQFFVGGQRCNVDIAKTTIALGKHYFGTRRTNGIRLSSRSIKFDWCV